MKFTTSFDIARLDKAIDHDSSIVLLGSCFSQNIGDKLIYYGFKTMINPFGVIFNPHSMAVLVEKSLSESFTKNDVQEHYSYLAHSLLNGINPTVTFSNLTHAGDQLKTRLKGATHFIITLGTAWIYELAATRLIVANCHQQPQKLFNKRLLDFEEITSSLQQMESSIYKMNPNAQIIYTLSPVRHTKDGIIENARSKARLHEALQQQCEQDKNYYFPSYEILMDELRDYRFYAQDMIHPNETAVDYVWSRFRESVLNTNLNPALQAIEKYRKLVAHRPKDNVAHLLQIDKMKEQIMATFPKIEL